MKSEYGQIKVVSLFYFSNYKHLHCPFSLVTISNKNLRKKVSINGEILSYQLTFGHFLLITLSTRNIDS